MAQASEITQGITFVPDFNLTDWEYNERFGFITPIEEQDEEHIGRVLGFGVPLSITGGFNDAKTVIPITRFADVPEELQTIDALGKGVGDRMYNTPQGVAGLRHVSAEHPIGAYTFDLSRFEIKDMRRDGIRNLGVSAVHFTRMVSTKLQGLEHVVNSIHDTYEEADAVHFRQPLRASGRQNLERHRLALVPSEFFIIRNSAITLKRVNE